MGVQAISRWHSRSRCHYFDVDLRLCYFKAMLTLLFQNKYLFDGDHCKDWVHLLHIDTNIIAIIYMKNLQEKAAVYVILFISGSLLTIRRAAYPQMVEGYCILIIGIGL